MPRLACLLVPMFPLAARLRSEPELISEAVIITEGNGNLARVVAATRRARKEGIHAGMTLPQARALLPKVIARSRDADCERSAQEALLEVAESFSPRIEDSGEGCVFVDIEGLERHFGSRNAECGLARGEAASSRPSGGGEGERSAGSRRPTRAAEDGCAPQATGKRQPATPPSTVNCQPSTWEHNLATAAIRAVERVGMPVRIGIAASKLAARVAAELPKTPRVVPAGEETGFLAPLPLTRLAPEIRAAETLRSWGISLIGELAHLPEGEVAARLGETGRDLHWLARGVDPRPLVPRPLARSPTHRR